MKTDLIIDLLEKEGKHIEEGWVKDIPLGRLAHPSELQGTIVYLASDASSYLNGSDIVCSYPFTLKLISSFAQQLMFSRWWTVDIRVGNQNRYKLPQS